MILVSLGTHERPFMRLVKEIERLIAEGKIKEKVVIQLGYTKYKFTGAECFDFIEFNKMRRLIRTCSVMITHAGTGSITDALDYGKVPVVVPRRKTADLDEHSDDHQVQITKEMEKNGKIIAVYDIKDLEAAIKKAQKLKFKKSKRKQSKILEIVDEKINEWNV